MTFASGWPTGHVTHRNNADVCMMGSFASIQMYLNHETPQAYITGAKISATPSVVT